MNQLIIHHCDCHHVNSSVSGVIWGIPTQSEVQPVNSDLTHGISQGGYLWRFRIAASFRIVNKITLSKYMGRI